MDRRRLAAAAVVGSLSGCAHPASQTAAPQPTVSHAARPMAATQSVRPDAGAASLAPVFMGDVEVVAHVSAAPIRCEDRITVGIELNNAAPGALEELVKRTGEEPSPSGSWAFTTSCYPPSADRLEPSHRRASFLIDFDEPAVQAVHARAIRICGESPTVDQLALFVNRYVEHKDMQRGFDIASQVARRHEGDCTEHAVLLAALARSFGYPARVVLGVVLVPIADKWAGFGHAWVEVHTSGQWRRADAAVPPELGARYLPMQVVRDEGPAFGRRLIESPLAYMFVKRVVLDPGR